MGTNFVHLCLAEEKKEYKGIWGLVTCEASQTPQITI